MKESILKWLEFCFSLLSHNIFVYIFKFGIIFHPFRDIYRQLFISSYQFLAYIPAIYCTNITCIIFHKKGVIWLVWIVITVDKHVYNNKRHWYTKLSIILLPLIYLIVNWKHASNCNSSAESYLNLITLKQSHNISY